MFQDKKIPVLKIVLAAWLILATLYVIYGEYNRLNMVVAQTSYNAGYQEGYQDSVVQLLNEVAKCQPVPITFNNQQVEVIGVACLQQGGAPVEGAPVDVPVEPVVQ